MPWPTTKTTAPKYRTPEHKARRQALADELRRNGTLTCTQPTCVMPTRTIRPGEPWALGHDDTGTTYLGPVHKRCNDLDGARRGNRRSRGLPDRPATAGRWVL